MKLHMKRFVVFLLASTVGHASADLVFFQGFEDVSRPVRGAVVISEIMSDPTEVSDSLGEWVELANTTGQPVDLGGCTLASSAGSAILPAITLVPADFSLIARSSDQAANGGLLADATFSFALTASGTLQLICAGAVIDQTSWASEQPGTSRTLDPTRISAIANDDPGNWCFATALYNASDKGSPGLANETCPGVVDPDPPPEPGELSITELMIDPAPDLLDADAEWVELRSTAAGMRNLAGCVLSNGTTDSSGFPSLQLAPGGYALIGRSTNSALNGGLSLDATFGFALTNTSGTISVKCQDVVINSVSWNGSVSGRSLQRDPVSTSEFCTVPIDTPAYAQSNFGTPGADNLPCPQ